MGTFGVAQWEGLVTDHPSQATVRCSRYVKSAARMMFQVGDLAFNGSNDVLGKIVNCCAIGTGSEQRHFVEVRNIILLQVFVIAAVRMGEHCECTAMAARTVVSRERVVCFWRFFSDGGRALMHSVSCGEMCCANLMYAGLAACRLSIRNSQFPKFRFAAFRMLICVRIGIRQAGTNRAARSHLDN